MGSVSSRIGLASGLQPGRRAQRSQQDDSNNYTYSFTKNNFCNYFFMGGERFEINDPDYLFGDNFDLNFLSCTKPHHIPYRQALQGLLFNLNPENKTVNKDSSNRVYKFSSSFNRILPRYRYRHGPDRDTSDAQTQTSNSTNSNTSRGIGSEPSQPIVMLVNIRKETLRLIKSPAHHMLESDTESLYSNASVSVSISDPNVYVLALDMYPYPNPVYNIEFTFDTEVDCSIRIFYLCTREVSPTGIIYKPQHATYKSKIYHYKRGLNQKFDQPEHLFEPHLFDEDLLIYKPLDLDGNHNSKAVFPIVIHCVALDGPMPRQSQSLIATIEKSQLDESYSIKSLKQLIFVGGIQYILQDIYGIENNPISSPGLNRLKADREAKKNARKEAKATTDSEDPSEENRGSRKPKLEPGNKSNNLDLSETSSLASLENFSRRHNRGSLTSCNNQKASLTGAENTFECVICMSEGRDTMLLPCRHLCLCSSCAQSLRYQANSCPICRCPFKAALNLRSIQRNSNQTADNMEPKRPPIVSSCSTSNVKSGRDGPVESGTNLLAGAEA